MKGFKYNLVSKLMQALLDRVVVPEKDKVLKERKVHTSSLSTQSEIDNYNLEVKTRQVVRSTKRLNKKLGKTS